MGIPWPAWLAIAYVLSAQSPPVIEPVESRGCSHWVVGVDGGLVQLVRFNLPANVGSRFVRVMGASLRQVYAEGRWAPKLDPGEFDLTGLVRPGAGNEIAVSEEARVLIVVTPKVHVARNELLLRQGHLSGRVWVRNTLENTVNVYLTLDGGGQFSTSATVPPGATQAVEVESAATWNRVVILTLEKQEEAIEGAYVYRERLVLPVR